MKISTTAVLAILTTILFACEPPIKEPKVGAITDVVSDPEEAITSAPNTALDTPIPLHTENPIDLTITQNIHLALKADENLSESAKNIKIMTIDGVVTLRGTVNSMEEREAVLQLANSVKGVRKIVDQLEVKTR